jgi:hypothetical protein
VKTEKTRERAAGWSLYTLTRREDQGISVSVTYSEVSLTYPIYFINFLNEKSTDTAGIRIRCHICVSAYPIVSDS